MKNLFKRIFSNPAEDLIILKLETLNLALQANDRETCQFYQSKLRSL